MKVVAPSYTILKELDSTDPVLRIEACGRICYKSEDRITAGTALPFVRNIIKRGHNSVLEMAAVSLRLEIDSDSLAMDFFELLPRFIQVDRLEKKILLLSGSIRAFRELIAAHGTVRLVKAVAVFLSQLYPVLFEDLTPSRGWTPQMGLAVEKIALREIDGLSPDLLAKHRFVAVKFVVGRAVTHELVRHRPCSFLQESQRYCRYSEDRFGNEVAFIRPLFYEEGSPEYLLWEEAMRETEKIYLKLLSSSTPQAARTVLPNSCKTEIIVFANLLEWFHILKLRCAQAAEPSMREVMLPLLADMHAGYPQVFENLASLSGRED